GHDCPRVGILALKARGACQRPPRRHFPSRSILTEHFDSLPARSRTRRRTSTALPPGTSQTCLPWSAASTARGFHFVSPSTRYSTCNVPTSRYSSRTNQSITAFPLTLPPDLRLTRGAWVSTQIFRPGCELDTSGGNRRPCSSTTWTVNQWTP